MTSFHRREFLDRSKKTALGLAAGVTILQNAGSVRGAPAADKVILAAVGVGGRGNHLATHPDAAATASTPTSAIPTLGGPPRA